MRTIVKVKEDLTGRRFGRLTVIEQVGDHIINTTGQHLSQWLCKCDCGNIKIIIGNALKSGMTKSCGCISKRGAKVRVKNNLVGEKFGKLTVIEQAEDYVEPNGNHSPRYTCICDCGNTINVRADALKTGHTKSCGCYQSESLKERLTIPNTYKLFDEYGICYDSTSDYFWKFDLDDYDLIKKYVWHADKRGYARGGDYNNRVKMHRLVLGVENAINKRIIVDHINGDPTDNRKSNLRLCTNEENSHNRCIHKNNSSGITGVSWINREQKWIATIGINGKLKFLGYFNNKEDAKKCRQEAEDKYYGEFSYKNSRIKVGDEYDLL